METKTKTETKTRNSFKKFIRNNIDTIIVSSLALAGGCVFGYTFRHTKGINRGGGEMLNMIVSKGECIMKNPDLGCFVFTAKKLS